MPRELPILCLILLSGLAALAGSDQPPNKTAFRLLLSEVQPGSMATQQQCTLVFTDRRFHHETASRKRGRDFDRKVYESELSEGDWNALSAILDSKEFRDLNVPRGVPPLVMQDSHIYTISVAREGRFQNMEFLDKKSRKPYESQLKPLFEWWKSMRGRHMSESPAPADGHCSLENNDAIFSQ